MLHSATTRPVAIISAACGAAMLLMGGPVVGHSDEVRSVVRASQGGWDERALTRLLAPPLGLPPVPVTEDNPPTAAKIALGRKLFFDRRLSLNNTMSCGMCHIPEHGFTNNELSTPIGIAGRSLRRNAPTVLNAAYSRLLFHDGRQASLEGQAISPLVARDELGNPSPESVRAKIVGLGDYDGLFEEAFGVGPSLELVGKAVASWERTLLAGDSPFDRWRYGGDRNAFTPQQSRGFTIFVGKGRCASCHAIGEEYALFTDGAFHNTGIGFLRSRQLKELQSPVDVEIAPKSRIEVSRKVIGQIGRPRDTDLGRFEVTSDPKDKWRYRTPTLRNISLTAPYMHDGSMRTLADVVDFYNRGGATHEAIDPLIRPIGLDDTEMDSLIAFLEGLTARNLAELRADARSIPTGN